MTLGGGVVYWPVATVSQKSTNATYPVIDVRVVESNVAVVDARQARTLCRGVGGGGIKQRTVLQPDQISSRAGTHGKAWKEGIHEALLSTIVRGERSVRSLQLIIERHVW